MSVEGAEVVAQAGSEDPEVGLRAVTSLRTLLEAVEELQVANAREQGWSWQRIASVLGVSKQAVHQKYGGGTAAPALEAIVRLALRRTRPRQAFISRAHGHLAEAAEQARELGHDHIGTEHFLLAMLARPDGAATRALRCLGASADELRGRILEKTGAGASTIDRDALATLGIDVDEVRRRLERTFGPGALERTRSACLSICPRAKRALAHAVEEAGDAPVGDDHLLMGVLSVPTSFAARVCGAGRRRSRTPGTCSRSFHPATGPDRAGQPENQKFLISRESCMVRCRGVWARDRFI